MDKIRVAVVMSGGGARGAFQVGALEYIHLFVNSRLPNLEYCVFSGSSTSTFTALMLAMHKYPMLLDIWRNKFKNGIHNNRLHAAWKILTGASGIHTSNPLEKYLEEHIRLKDIKIDALFHLASLQNMEGISFSKNDFTSDELLIEAVKASMRTPGYRKPVAQLNTSSGPYYSVTDGSMLRTTPIGDVLSFRPDVVFIITTAPLTGSEEVPALDSTGETQADAVSLAYSLYAEAAPDALFQRDIEEFIRINEMVKQAAPAGESLQNGKEPAFRYYDYVLMAPPAPLGHMENYSRGLLNTRWNLGWKTAENAFKSFKPLCTPAREEPAK